MEAEDQHLARVAEAQVELLSAGMDLTWVDTEGEVRSEVAWFEDHPEAFTQLEQARQHDADAQAKESDAKAMADNVTHEQRAIAAINEAIALEVAAGELHDETAAHYAAAPRVWQTKQEKLQQEANALRLKAAEMRAAIMREVGYATGNLEEPSEEE